VKLPGKPTEKGLYALVAAGALLVIYLVAFVVSNSGDVNVSFVFVSGNVPLILLMVLCVVIGVAIGALITRVAARLRRVESS
jgi:uncharacterized integral membrane protein